MLVLWPIQAVADYPGPYEATVTSVYDGDTFTAVVDVFPTWQYEGPVRVRGVDTPEIRGKCAREKALAIEARDRAREWLSGSVRLYDVEEDKYGRILATVRTDGVDLAERLIGAGLGREYHGERRSGWCE